jgi:hypothetical protein
LGGPPERATYEDFSHDTAQSLSEVECVPCYMCNVLGLKQYYRARLASLDIATTSEPSRTSSRHFHRSHSPPSPFRSCLKSWSRYDPVEGRRRYNPYSNEYSDHRRRISDYSSHSSSHSEVPLEIIQPRPAFRYEFEDGRQPILRTAVF